jgi:hypothetical protein
MRMEAVAFLLLGERRLERRHLVGADGQDQGEQADKGERTDHMDLQGCAGVEGQHTRRPRGFLARRRLEFRGGCLRDDGTAS